MAVSQSLSVTEVAGSANVAANSSKVRILWTSTQTYESWNGYTRTAYYWVSVNGGAETKYSVSYTLPKGTTSTILDVTITVNHKDDGSGTVKVRTWMDTDISVGIVEKSQTITLATIARASTMDSLSCSTKYFDGAMTYKYTPKSASYYNRCNITLNLNGSHVSVKTINIGTKSASQQTGTVTLSSSELSTVYNKIPNGNSGVLRFTLLTYSDSGYSNQVGDAENKEVALYIPENSSTKPELVISLEPVGSLPSAFSGLYVQGKTKVKAIVVSVGKYGATIKSTTMSVEGKSYGPDESYTSDYLPSYGDVTVTTVAKDSRGFSTTLTSKIPVIAYTRPKITVSVCGRCDASGNLTDGGTYLKIKATRSYNPVKSGTSQKNFCKIRYRYKLSTASSYSAWTTILAGDSLNSDTAETGALLGGVLAVNASYHVQVQAIDDIGEAAESTINIPTEEVYMHRTKNSMGLGKYAEGENLLDLGWDIAMNGNSLYGLGTPTKNDEAVPLGYLFNRHTLAPNTAESIVFSGSTSAIIAVQGSMGNAYMFLVYQGYGIGGTSRCHVAPLQKGSSFSYGILNAAESTHGIGIWNNTENNVVVSVIPMSGNLVSITTGTPDVAEKL